MTGGWLKASRRVRKKPAGQRARAHSRERSSMFQEPLQRGIATQAQGTRTRMQGDAPVRFCGHKRSRTRQAADANLCARSSSSGKAPSAMRPCSHCTALAWTRGRKSHVQENTELERAASWCRSEKPQTLTSAPVVGEVEQRIPLIVPACQRRIAAGGGTGHGVETSQENGPGSQNSLKDTQRVDKNPTKTPSTAKRRQNPQRTRESGTSKGVRTLSEATGQAGRDHCARGQSVTMSWNAATMAPTNSEDKRAKHRHRTNAARLECCKRRADGHRSHPVAATRQR